MIFALHKFKHYLLGNMFVFYVDHMALVYLVNKPQVLGRIARWLLLFLEYDFTILYKPSKTHVITNALSRLPDIREPTSAPNQTIDASMFSKEPELLNDIKEFLKTCQIKGMLFVHQKQKLVRRTKTFTLKNGELYRMGQDNSL